MEIKKFVFGETLEKAIEAVPEEHRLKYYTYIKDYGLHGREPELSGFELATWVQMKAMIDITIPKRNNASPISKVGAPYGNSNAKKTTENNSKQLDELFYGNQLQNNSSDLLNVNENVNENVNGGFSEFGFKYTPPESQEAKEDATALFNKAREYWNELKIKPECREIMMRRVDIPDILRTFQQYAWEEIRNAIKNFAWHKMKAGQNYHDPPPYGSLAGFLKTGVERYFDDNALEQQFKKTLSPEARKEQEKNESLDADQKAMQARRKEHEEAKNNAVRPDEVPSLAEAYKQIQRNKGENNGNN